MSNADSFDDFVLAVAQRKPRVAFVLGSGMGAAVEQLEPLLRVPYGRVPGLDVTGVAGHRGQLTLAECHGRPVLVLEGRLHYYEGHPWERVTSLVSTVAGLGVKAILHTNAAGGIRDDLGPGSLMAVTDHIEWTRPFWWRAAGPGGMGPSRPSPYSAELLGALSRAAAKNGLALRQGIYASLTGPCYETPAEIRALRSWGADAVGMSTAREVHRGCELGLACAAVSLITNRAAGLGDSPLSHDEVLATAATQTERLAALLAGFLQELPR
jgi:purine-nucleoside phosphorylase